MASHRVVALIMAAGRAKRFGSDKRFAPLPGGKTLLAASLADTRHNFAKRFLVISPQDEPGQLLCEEAGIDWLIAPRAAYGLGFSIADSVTELLRRDLDAESLAVVLGDMPRIADTTYTSLVSTAYSERIVRPYYQGRPGHPVLFGRDFWPALTRLANPEGARELIATHSHALHQIKVDDPGILLDVDYPRDLTKLFS